MWFSSTWTGAFGSFTRMRLVAMPRSNQEIKSFWRSTSSWICRRVFHLSAASLEVSHLSSRYLASSSLVVVLYDFVSADSFGELVTCSSLLRTGLLVFVV